MRRGLAGVSGSSTVIENVDLKDLQVEGAKYAGGLIGYVKGQGHHNHVAPAEGLTVIGGFAQADSSADSMTPRICRSRGTAATPAEINRPEIRVKGRADTAKLNTTVIQRYVPYRRRPVRISGHQHQQKSDHRICECNRRGLYRGLGDERPKDMRYKRSRWAACLEG